MRRLLTILLFCMAVPVFGAQPPEGRHTFRLGWGDMLFETMAFQPTVAGIHPSPESLPSSYTRNEKYGFGYTGHIYAEYLYRFTKVVSVGIQADAEGIFWKEGTFDRYHKLTVPEVPVRNWDIVLMPTVRFTWLHRPLVRLYSGLGAGAIFASWSFYRIGYIKARTETMKRNERDVELGNLILQIYETIVYLIVCLIGVFLLLNENFTNQALNLMTGGFTIFNGIVGVIGAIKNCEKYTTFGWKFMLGLTIIELGLGAYFIFMSNTINNVGLGVMGVITTIAGLIEVISSLRKDVLQKTVQDGKDIVKILKEEK